MYLRLVDFLLISAFLSIAAGCGGGSTADPEFENPAPTSEPTLAPTPEPTPEETIVSLKQQVQEYVDQKVDWFADNNIRCDADPENVWCNVETVVFDDGQFDPARTDAEQTILVLDYGLSFPAVLRYRSRIKAYYQYNPANRGFVPYNARITISSAGKKILTELDKFRYERSDGTTEPAFIPAAWLSDIAEVYRDAIPNDNTDYETGREYSSHHGTSLLNYLLEHNPKAEFVLIDTASFLPFVQHSAQICDKDYAGFEAIILQASQSLLTDVIAKNDVDYVNYSGGHQLGGVLRDWEINECEGEIDSSEARTLLFGLTAIYEAMFSQDNLLGIQSGIRNGQDLDATDLKHRLRVVSFTSKAEDIALSDDGSMFWRETYNSYQKLFEDHTSIDLFVNFGITDFSFDPSTYNSTPKMTSDIFGMQYRPDWALHSSWAAPVATSVAIYTNSMLKNADPDYSFNPARIIEVLAPEGCLADEQDADNPARQAFAENGSCRIQDPLKFRKLELHRLGYLD